MRINAERDREFLDVMKSFSVTEAELAALVRMPALSIGEAKQYVRGTKGNGRHRRQAAESHVAR